MWEKKVKSLRERVSHWKEQSKKAQTKDRKDYCIRQKHLWNMELSYWEKKLNAFTITEVTDSFRNNQLNDTRIITKYAYHYLKTAFDHVSVQRGETTSAFRKIIGIQQRDEQKDRNNHSHHAIDAAVLTLVPSAKERNKMMKLFYLMKEYETNPTYRQELEKEKQTYFPNDVTAVKDYIEQNIFVTHIAKDQTLTPAKRRKRIRGKIDRKHEQWITGDCIRGRLHKDSFYGCIEIDGEQHFVIRRVLKYKANKQDSGFSNWKELKEAIVDKGLYNRLIQPFCQEGSNEPSVDFKTAITEQGGLKDNGRKVRHIRCYTSVKKPLQIKEQTYKSKKDYKNYYYAEVGDLYTMCKYENKDTKEVEYKTYNLFQIAQNHNLPVSFHVRDAFDDFWSIFDNFHLPISVLHSFSDNEVRLEQGLNRGLYIGVNGLSTFAKLPHAPLDRIILETDAPYLTPKPFRGTINRPGYIYNIAEWAAQSYQVTLDEVAKITTQNAEKLFKI